MQPQTLASATMLLYIEGLFNLVRGQALFVVGVIMFPAAWAIANNKRWGWRLGVGAAALSVLIRLLASPMNLAFALLFPVVLLALLLHPQSREHQKIWFE